MFQEFKYLVENTALGLYIASGFIMLWGLMLPITMNRRFMNSKLGKFIFNPFNLQSEPDEE